MTLGYQRLSHSFEKFDQSIANFDGRTVPTALQSRNYEQVIGFIGDVTIQQVREGGANFYQSVMDKGVVTVGVGLPGLKQMWAMGQHLSPSVMAIARPEEEAYTRCDGDGEYLLITVPFAKLSGLVEGVDPSQHKRLFEGAHRLEVFERNWCALTAIVARSLQLLSIQNQMSDSCWAALEQELLQELVTSIVYSPKDESNPGRPRISRSRTQVRAREFCHEFQPDQWAVPGLAEYIGIHERSLRNIFLELYGVSPKRFLTNHRLVEVRERLLDRDSDKNIAEIASKVGFWQWGQMSRDYKNLFGESPSETRRS